MPAPELDLFHTHWRKASFSQAQGDCVEVADLGGHTAVRDSKNPAGPALLFDSTAWHSFVTSIRDHRP